MRRVFEQPLSSGPDSDLGHKNIGVRFAAVAGLDGIDRRKVAGKGEPRHIGVAGGIHSDARNDVRVVRKVSLSALRRNRQRRRRIVTQELAIALRRASGAEKVFG